MINAIEYPDPAETHIELDSKNEPIDRRKEQDQDSDIKEVKKWIKTNEIPELTYANSRLKKYAKQFNRLVIEDEVLLRNFYDDTGKIKHKQFCVPKHLWNETIYRVHNSMTKGHFGINEPQNNSERDSTSQDSRSFWSAQ